MIDKLCLLAAKLKECPTRSLAVDKKLVLNTWNQFRKIDPDNGDVVTGSVLIGCIQFDPEMLSPLLSIEELAQLETLAANALERYQQCVNPPNPVGQALADQLKELT